MSASRQTLVGDLGRAMQAYQRSTQAFDDEVGRQLHLNPADLRCLDWLTEGAMSARRLSEAVGLSTAATTSMIDRLETKGFVRRLRSQTDRRQVNVELTEDGRARTWAYYGPLVTEGASIFDGYTKDELAAMRDHLIAMRDLTDRHRARLADPTGPGVAAKPTRAPRPGA
jgi:DNA-binding MarR family transcriptional regulator